MWVFEALLKVGFPIQLSYNSHTRVNPPTGRRCVRQVLEQDMPDQPCRVVRAAIGTDLQSFLRFEDTLSDGELRNSPPKQCSFFNINFCVCVQSLLSNRSLSNRACMPRTFSTATSVRERLTVMCDPAPKCTFMCARVVSQYLTIASSLHNLRIILYTLPIKE